MLVSDFHKKYPCCSKGIAEGLKYETMKEWWEATERGDWMLWCWYVDKRYAATEEQLKTWCVELDKSGASCDLYLLANAILCSICPAEKIRSVIPCPWE